MIAATLLFLAAPAAPLPLFLPAHDAGAAERQDGQDEEKREKRRFPSLNSSERKKASEGLHELRRSKKIETAEAALEELVALGAGVVPDALDAWARFEDGEEEERARLPLLVALLDRALADADLDLAWREVGRRTAAGARRYLVRRLADSERKDAAEMLAERLEEAGDAREAYEAARGLAWRELDAGLPALLAAAAEDWGENRARLRADFAGLERGPLSVQVSGMIRAAKTRDDKLAALRLFELVGGKAQLSGLKPALRDPDNAVKLAVINACRAVHGQDPVDQASVMQIIQFCQEWEGKL